MSDLDAVAKRREHLLEQLGLQAETMRSSEGWVAWLKFASRFRNYSLGNQLLIQAQRPGARYVAGFRTWQSMGRHVRKGEKGIAILAPMVRRARETEVTNVDDEKVLLGFRVVFVFDVTQTDGEEIPMVPFPKVLSVDEWLFEQLVTVAAKAEISVKLLDDSANSALGWWNGRERTITIVDNQDLASKTATMLHELAHAHDPLCLDPSQSVAERELVAESAAYLVGTEMGIEMRDQSSHYLMTYGATRERLLELAEEVLAVTQRLAGLTAELPLPMSG